MRCGLWGGVVAVVWVVGCGGVAEPGRVEERLGEGSAALGVANGRNLNGSNLNGSNLNGQGLNQTLVSVGYAGASLEDRRGRRPLGWREPLDAVRLEGTVFHGWRRGRPVSGEDFERARFVGNLGDGSQVELRVDAITPGRGEGGDVWTYRVAYREPADGRWYPLCGDAKGRPVDAIAVEGRWDYREGVPGLGGAKYDDPGAFTFACEGAAIAKCIRFGYKPWASVDGESLATHHQACTRLIRADYCGDGTSHTVDGQWVNLYDGLGVQRDTEGWALEAEWDTEGARCVTESNRSHEPVSCPGARMKPRCGTPEAFSTGTLLQSETP